jgi:hypothetical protein
VRNVKPSLRHIWELVDGIVTQQDTHDQTNIDGNCPLQVLTTAYDAYFLGTISFAPLKRIWKSWVPMKCKFFICLATNIRCWTSDWLAKRGLPHPPACPLCDQADETIQHILVSCVFSREVRTLVLRNLNLVAVVPPISICCFQG